MAKAKIKDPVEEHLKRKIKILKKEMLIPLTNEELAHLSNCTTISSIDEEARKLILKHWAEDEEE